MIIIDNRANKIKEEISNISDFIRINISKHKQMTEFVLNQESYDFNIYQGLPGILLFFLELYRFEKNEKQLSLIENIADYLLKFSKTEISNPNWSFITGNIGIAFVLAKTYNITLQKKYREAALKITDECIAHYDFDNKLLEYLNGLSGTILGLHHISVLTGDDTIVIKSRKFIEYLLNNIKVSRNGIYCDRQSDYIYPVTSFAHGISGIAFVLLELGTFYNKEFFNELATQFLLSANNYFDKQINNWPDSRAFAWSKKEYKKYLSIIGMNKYLNLKPRKDLISWCSGAAGMGLVFLHAKKLLNTDIFDPYILASLGKSKQKITNDKDIEDYCLCHGLNGISELCIQAYLLYGEPIFLDSALEFTMKTMDWMKYVNKKETKLFNIGLFTGLSGIGYTLIRILNINNFNSVLLPILPKNTNDNNSENQEISYSSESLLVNAFLKHFNLTLFEIQKQSVIIDYDYFKFGILEYQNFTDVLLGRLRKLLKINKFNNKKLILSIFKFESALFKFYQNHNKYFLFEEHIKLNYLRFEKLKYCNLKKWLGFDLITDKSFKIIKSNILIRSNLENNKKLISYNLSQKKYYYYLQHRKDHVKWIIISKLSLDILLEFRKSNCLANVVERSIIKKPNAMNNARFIEILVKQVKELCRIGALRINDREKVNLKKRY